MKYDKVIIKQIPEDNQAARNLKNYKRSRFPRCTDYFQASEVAPGRYLTGLDPKGLELLQITDPEERKRISEERTELLKVLEDYLAEDLSATSSYWERLVVKIDTDNDQILNRSNPLDIIKYHLLLANGFVAPSEKDSSSPEFLAAKYYFKVEEVEADEKVSSQKLRDQARAELYKVADNKDYMLILGAYLEGGKYKKTMSPNTLYGMLSDYLESKTEPENVSRFLKAVKLPVEDLQYKITVETAIKKKIIKFKEGQFYRGGVNLGRNVAEVMKNLQLPDFSNEFISIHDDVQSR